MQSHKKESRSFISNRDMKTHGACTRVTEKETSTRVIPASVALQDCTFSNIIIFTL